MQKTNEKLILCLCRRSIFDPSLWLGQTEMSPSLRHRRCRLLTFGEETEGEKSERDDFSSLKGGENRIVEGSMIRLASQDPFFD